MPDLHEMGRISEQQTRISANAESDPPVGVPVGVGDQLAGDGLPSSMPDSHAGLDLAGATKEELRERIKKCDPFANAEPEVLDKIIDRTFVSLHEEEEMRKQGMDEAEIEEQEWANMGKRHKEKVEAKQKADPRSESKQETSQDTSIDQSALQQNFMPLPPNGDPRARRRGGRQGLRWHIQKLAVEGKTATRLEVIERILNPEAGTKDKAPVKKRLALDRDSKSEKVAAAQQPIKQKLPERIVPVDIPVRAQKSLEPAVEVDVSATALPLPVEQVVVVPPLPAAEVVRDEPMPMPEISLPVVVTAQAEVVPAETVFAPMPSLNTMEVMQDQEVGEVEGGVEEVRSEALEFEADVEYYVDRQEQLESLLPLTNETFDWEQESQEWQESYDPDTIETYQQLLVLSLAEETQPVSLPDFMGSTDLFAADREMFAESPGNDFTFEDFIEAQPVREEPLTLEIIRQQAAEQPLEQTLAQLIECLQNEVEISDETVEVRTILQEIQELLPANFLELESDELRPKIEITPEMVDKLLQLLRAIGYEEPGQVLVLFVKKYDMDFLLQAVQSLCQVQSDLDRQHFSMPVLDDDDEDANAKPGYAARLLLSPLLAFSS